MRYVLLWEIGSVAQQSSFVFTTISVLVPEQKLVSGIRGFLTTPPSPKGGGGYPPSWPKYPRSWPKSPHPPVDLQKFSSTSEIFRFWKFKSPKTMNFHQYLSQNTWYLIEYWPWHRVLQIYPHIISYMKENIMFLVYKNRKNLSKKVTHTHTHTHANTHINTHTTKHAQTHTQTHSHMHNHTYTHSHPQTLFHTLAHRLTHKHTHIHTHTLTHTHTHTHTDTHTHTHTHAHINTQTNTNTCNTHTRTPTNKYTHAAADLPIVWELKETRRILAGAHALIFGRTRSVNRMSYYSAHFIDARLC